MKNKNHHKYYSGFTLIELLVVIAIIGVLSSIVLANLSSARSKGIDASIKTQLASIRAQGELLFSENQCFSTSACTASVPAVAVAATCATGNSVAASIFSDTKIYSLITPAIASSGGFGSCAATVGGTAWAVAVQLKLNNATAWCVDSTGASKQISDGSAYTQATLNADISGAVCGS